LDFRVKNNHFQFDVKNTQSDNLMWKSMIHDIVIWTWTLRKVMFYNVLNIE